MTSFLDGNRLPAGLFCGPGCRHRLGEALAALSVRRLYVIASASLLRGGELRNELMAAAGDRLAAVVQTAGRCGAAEIVVAAEHAAALSADCVLSVGGGVAHDMAKAVALCVPSGRPVAAFLVGAAPVAVMPLPVIAIPTTFSAAEMVAGGAVVLASGAKGIFGHPRVQPRQVFLDGELAAGAPRPVLAASGLNAVHHCLEALAARGRQAMSDAWALFALQRLFRLLPALAPAAPPVTVETYQELLEAAALSGLAYGISGLGVGHAICHSLAGRWDISHGNANAVILPHSVAFNLPYAPDQLALAGPDLTARLAGLCETLQTPRTLRALGLPEGNFDVIATDVLADPITAGNPRVVSREDVKAILAASW